MPSSHTDLHDSVPEGPPLGGPFLLCRVVFQGDGRREKSTMQMNPVALPLRIAAPLRGHRTYLQSATLFDILVGKTGANRNIALSFRRKVEHELVAVSAEGAAAPESHPVRFSGESADARFDLLLIEAQPLKRLDTREPYDEPAVIADSRIDGSTIFSESGSGSVIDRIVALNKRLIAQTTAPQKVLIFSKIYLTVLPDARASLQVQLKSRLGLKLFRSTISSDHGEIGEIVFYGT